MLGSVNFRHTPQTRKTGAKVRFNSTVNQATDEDLHCEFPLVGPEGIRLDKSRLCLLKSAVGSHKGGKSVQSVCGCDMQVEKLEKASSAGSHDCGRVVVPPGRVNARRGHGSGLRMGKLMHFCGVKRECRCLRSEKREWERATLPSFAQIVRSGRKRVCVSYDRPRQVGLLIFFSVLPSGF